MIVGYRIVKNRLWYNGKTGYTRTRVNPIIRPVYTPDSTREMPTRTRPDPQVRNGYGLRVYTRG